jgi:hypothetical protein
VFARLPQLFFGTQGSFFGEIALFFSRPRTASIRAATYTDIYVLSKQNLDEVLSFYPEIKERILTAAQERLKENEKRQQANTNKETKPNPPAVPENNERVTTAAVGPLPTTHDSNAPVALSNPNGAFLASGNASKLTSMASISGASSGQNTPIATVFPASAFVTPTGTLSNSSAGLGADIQAGAPSIMVTNSIKDGIDPAIDESLNEIGASISENGEVLLPDSIFSMQVSSTYDIASGNSSLSLVSVANEKSNMDRYQTPSTDQMRARILRGQVSPIRSDVQLGNGSGQRGSSTNFGSTDMGSSRNVNIRRGSLAGLRSLNPPLPSNDATAHQRNILRRASIGSPLLRRQNP